MQSSGLRKCTHPKALVLRKCVQRSLMRGMVTKSGSDGNNRAPQKTGTLTRLVLYRPFDGHYETIKDNKSERSTRHCRARDKTVTTRAPTCALRALRGTGVKRYRDLMRIHVMASRNSAGK